MAAPTQPPTLGRVIHYVLPDGRRAGEVRAAMVTNVFPSAADGMCNGTVFLDQLNDADSKGFFGSAKFDDSATPAQGTWHWPPRA